MGILSNILKRPGQLAKQAQSKAKKEQQEIAKQNVFADFNKYYPSPAKAVQAKPVPEAPKPAPATPQPVPAAPKPVDKITPPGPMKTGAFDQDYFERSYLPDVMKRSTDEAMGKIDFAEKNKVLTKEQANEARRRRTFYDHLGIASKQSTEQAYLEAMKNRKR